MFGRIKLMLHDDPSKWIGFLGTIVTAAVMFTRLTREQGGAIQHILDGALMLLVPGTAVAIRTQAYAPATVVTKVQEAASTTLETVVDVATMPVEAVTSVVGGVTKGVLGKLIGG